MEEVSKEKEVDQDKTDGEGKTIGEEGHHQTIGDHQVTVVTLMLNPSYQCVREMRCKNIF